MTDRGIHYYAIRHNITGKWLMCNAHGVDCHDWTYDLYLADVWQPDDMLDEDLQALPRNAHWQAFTWAEYRNHME